MAKAVDIPATTRAYTVKLSGDGSWRDLLWKTHVTVNRGAQAWGDWLLSLRAGLPASLGDDCPERRVLLALSWLSVESPASLAPESHIVARGNDPVEKRNQQVLDCFCAILGRLGISTQEDWLDACKPALTARIRDDAVWVDRYTCFSELEGLFPGLAAEWASGTLFHFLGNAEDYFALPDAEAAASTEAKDFVQKAGGWLSRNWGAGQKSDSAAISGHLRQLVNGDVNRIVGRPGRIALGVLVEALGHASSADADCDALFKQLKQAVGWRGRPSKGATALKKIKDAQYVSDDLWQTTVAKLNEEIVEKSSTKNIKSNCPDWMPHWRQDVELRLGMPYRVNRDLIWEHGVTLDHALRRVSSAHTWIKRAEAERRRFREDADKIESVPQVARDWLDAFRETRSSASGAIGDYLIRKRAIDGWDKIVQAWAELGSDATRKQRIGAARDVQANLEEGEKFGDIQLFAGFGDENDDDPQPCLADDAAICIWRDVSNQPNADILKDYVAATVAKHDEGRFKVPAYRHPDPLRHPIYVDFGNSRWDITYSALKAAQGRHKTVERLSKAKTEKTRAKLQRQLDAKPDLSGVTLGVWNGERVESLALRWHGRRFWKDLDLGHFDNREPAEAVSRADRLGRAAAGQEADVLVKVAEVFQQKDWNGRLQVSREQLDRLADLVYGRHGDPDFSKLERLHDDPRSRRHWERLSWFITTSAKLRPHGPWLDYVAAGLPDGIEYKKGRNGYYLEYAANKDRKGRARLELARLPGLRVLSLDLGHRYAAACAVWETLTQQQMAEACRAANHSKPTGGEFYIHLNQQTQKIQKSGRNKGQAVTQTTIYRRIGPDVLPDGSVHPVPWARLDRQFFIKLQGEDRPARAASNKPEHGINETAMVAELANTLGLLHEDADAGRGRGVDELMRRAVRIATLGLKRHARRAKIAYAFKPDCPGIPGMGGNLVPITGGDDAHVRFLTNALLDWHSLAVDTQWDGSEARRLWDEHIRSLPHGFEIGEPPWPDPSAERPTRKQQRDLEDERRKLLEPIARHLAQAGRSSTAPIYSAWVAQWDRDNGQCAVVPKAPEGENGPANTAVSTPATGWHAHLRLLTRWIMGRHLPGAASKQWNRNLGGVSLTRIATMRALYQLHKAFAMRPRPDKVQGAPEKGESNSGVAQSILNAMERMRDQRVKQIASRIVEAALGVGKEQKRVWDAVKKSWRYPKRPRELLYYEDDQGEHGDRRFKNCHAVVIENLRNYRPDELQTRRENRALMNWSSGKVRKYLEEACQLHGLHLREVMPNYTSRQCSRTGLPGVRCEDVPINEFLTAPWWNKDVNSAEKRINAGGTDSLDRMLVDLRKKWSQASDQQKAKQRVLRLPRKGGDLFVTGPPFGCPIDNHAVNRAIQADLNAAANIGLRALLDPDFPGKWWYVPCDPKTKLPSAGKVKGGILDHLGQLQREASADDAAQGKNTKGTGRRRATKTKEIVNLWRDPAALTLAGAADREKWYETAAYWNMAKARVVPVLRQCCGLPGE